MNDEPPQTRWGYAAAICLFSGVSAFIMALAVYFRLQISMLIPVGAALLISSLVFIGLEMRSTGEIDADGNIDATAHVDNWERENL